MTPSQPYTVQIVEWSLQHEVLAKIRTDVFVEEQRVPVEIIMDELDANGVHVAATDAAGNVIGTGRLVLHPSVPRIGRMAVTKSWRSAGVGGQILRSLCDAAKQRGFGAVMVHSQTHASPFYFKHGFLSHGSEFFEAGIPHQEMHKHI
ncbi:MAG: GNAT family N-acetyltransferase [Burkholderiales bacterium]|nr:GNAT family N-acetyltransferase [Burkholderiales bacterium]